MAFSKRPRDRIIHGLGLLVAGFASIGMDIGNNRFNGRMIDEYHCTKFLNDNMVIRRFYLHESLIRHNFLVFQTDSGHTFRVHLIAAVTPTDYQPISVVIARTYWKPTTKSIGMCDKTARDLKRAVQHQVEQFGTFEVGYNDCRHFARNVAAFLAS
ncbi:unnamed protein product [Rotaria magnacalcarata]|uniref:Uncharacterized protein n=1 Tax=Rotaria magnacalcarata TaxID=392030 RepID=A0A816UZG8_9BILA|nr:unnamed protein product [Rotaria magnacalcarata]CAF1676322.1 unnamed protein product [Rotaria magnacalcarata]CAF2107698.1 unnamed protein product [Rotaria magnacalcarata]CAF2201684.1 unnamed protein product [Rotaria magnacalcarata]CAF2204765.1 unnamed protein product [Rotaria magnacalcarata]